MRGGERTGHPAERGLRGTNLLTFPPGKGMGRDAAEGGGERKCTPVERERESYDFVL